MTDWTPFVSKGIEVRERVPLRDFTTFRLGGPCACLLNCETGPQLVDAVSMLARLRIPFLAMGGGSNLLVSDRGYDGVILRYYSKTPDIHMAGGVVEVSGSTLLDDLVNYTVRQGMEGLVYASGIPGTVGGAIAGNAGAYGRQIGDSLIGVRLVDERGTVREEVREALHFAYRTSRLQQSRETVLSASLQLRRGDPDELAGQREEILELRKTKHPDWKVVPTAGSFFKNIEPTSSAERRQAAGWFLEQAGAKSMSVGGARVFEKHANIIVADKGCSAQDVLDLSRRMAEAVKQKYGLVLTPEVRLVGSFQ